MLLLSIIYDNMQIKRLKSKYYKSPVFSDPFGNGKKFRWKLIEFAYCCERIHTLTYYYIRERLLAFKRQLQQNNVAYVYITGNSGALTSRRVSCSSVPYRKKSLRIYIYIHTYFTLLFVYAYKGCGISRKKNIENA